MINKPQSSDHSGTYCHVTSQISHNVHFTLQNFAASGCLFIFLCSISWNLPKQPHYVAALCITLQHFAEGLEHFALCPPSSSFPWSLKSKVTLMMLNPETQ